jgi:hypothetical protein
MILVISISIILFILSMIGMYLVKDYNDGIYYKGFVGKIQKLIVH